MSLAWQGSAMAAAAAASSPGAPPGTPALRQPRLRNRRVAKNTLGLAALVLAVAPFVTGLLSGARVLRGAPAPLAEADGLTLVIPFGSNAAWICQNSPRASSRIARAAGYDEKPGGRPDGPDEDGEDAFVTTKEKPVLLEDMQKESLKLYQKWLGSLKGKCVPVGPKPWDKHKFRKVIINVQLEPAQAGNTKIMNQCIEELRRITGVHPRITKMPTNNAVLGWREGMPSGVSVQVYGDLMYDFLRRFNMIVLPRIRDFEGLFPTSITENGDFWMDVKTQEPFKELDEMMDQREIVHDFSVGIVNNCFTRADGLGLMKDYGFPFGDPRPKKARVFQTGVRRAKKKKRKR